MRSKHGRAITSIRDNEIAARATGVNVTKYKLVAFMVSAFFAGIAGVLFSYTQARVQAPNSVITIRSRYLSWSSSAVWAR